jgi:hypothetical protein
MSTKLDRISELAGESRQMQFLSIAHLLTPEALMEAFKSLRKDCPLPKPHPDAKRLNQADFI